MVGHRGLVANVDCDDIFGLCVFQAGLDGLQEFFGRLACISSRVLGSSLFLFGARLWLVRQGLSSFRKKAAATVIARLPVGRANCLKVARA